jgi:hypothetical protein
LKPGQWMSLAVALRWLAKSESEWIENNREPGSPPRLQPIDATGLTESEQGMLQKLTATEFSDHQVESIRRALIFKERATHHIPIEWECGCEIPHDAVTQIARAQGEDGPLFGKIFVSLRGSGVAKLNPRYDPDHRTFCAVVFESTPSDKNGATYLMVSFNVALFHDGKLVKIIGENAVNWMEQAPRRKL